MRRGDGTILVPPLPARFVHAIAKSDSVGKGARVRRTTLPAAPRAFAHPTSHFDWETEAS